MALQTGCVYFFTVYVRLCWDLKAVYRQKKKKVELNLNLYHNTDWISTCPSGHHSLFIKEDIGVKVVDCICCDEGEDYADGTGDQNRHVVGVRSSRAPSNWIPVWGPVVAWKNERSWTEWFPWKILITSSLTPCLTTELFFIFYNPVGFETVCSCFLSLTFLCISFLVTCKDMKTH